MSFLQWKILLGGLLKRRHCLKRASMLQKTETTISNTGFSLNTRAWQHNASSSCGMDIHKFAPCRGIRTNMDVSSEETNNILLSDDGREGPTTLCSSSADLQRNDAQKDADLPELKESGQKVSERHNLAIVFTCKVCQTRSAKTMSRQTYEKGVVIVRCGGCKNLHLIADRLGWFGERGSVEDFLRQQGVEVRKGSEESYEFTMEDLTGWTPEKK